MTEEQILEVVRRAIREEGSHLYVDHEMHFRHHEFIGEMIKWSETIKGTACKTIVKAVVGALIGLIVLGFLVWGRPSGG